MKRIASLLMLATRRTLWKAAGITLASCLAEAGLFLAALSGWQDTVRTAYYEYSNPMGLEGLLMQYPLSWCFRIGLVLVCAVLAFLGWEGSSRVSYTLRRLSVGHRALTLLWAGYGFFCLLFFCLIRPSDLHLIHTPHTFPLYIYTISRLYRGNLDCLIILSLRYQ